MPDLLGGPEAKLGRMLETLRSFFDAQRRGGLCAHAELLEA